MNNTVFSGYLATEPKQRGENGPITARISVRRPFAKDKEVDFLTITVWGKQGEYLKEYGAVGSMIEVEGYLRTSTFGEGDKKRTDFEIIVEHCHVYNQRPKDEPETTKEHAASTSGESKEVGNSYWD